MREFLTTNKMPKHLERLQFKEDSIRARKWFEMTKDSSYIEKYTELDDSKNSCKKKETSGTSEATPRY